MNKVSMLVSEPTFNAGRYTVRVTVPCKDFPFEFNPSICNVINQLSEVAHLFVGNIEDRRRLERICGVLKTALNYDGAQLEALFSVKGSKKVIDISFDSPEVAKSFAAQMPFKVLNHLDNWLTDCEVES